jgi:ADP-ribose pyrophosphatase
MTKRLEPWRVLESREVLDGRPRLIVANHTVELPDGRRVEDFWKIQMFDYVVVAAWDEADRLIVERQYKHGPERVCLTLVAGAIEPGEPPLVAAKRELLEETGHEAAHWTALGRFVVGANAGIGMAHFFKAGGARLVQPPNSGDLEEMRIEHLDEAQIRQALAGGEFAMVSCAAALALAILHEKGAGD